MPTNDDAPPPSPSDSSTDEEASSPPENEPDAPSAQKDLPGPLRTSVGALWALLGPPDDPGEPDDEDAPDAEDP